MKRGIVFLVMLVLLSSMVFAVDNYAVLYKDTSNNKIKLAEVVNIDAGSKQIINSNSFGYFDLKKTTDTNGNKFLGIKVYISDLNYDLTSLWSKNVGEMYALGTYSNTEEAKELVMNNASVLTEVGDSLYDVFLLGSVIYAEAPKVQGSADRVRLVSNSDIMNIELDDGADFTDVWGSAYSEVKAIHLTTNLDAGFKLSNGAQAKNVWIFPNPVNAPVTGTDSVTYKCEDSDKGRDPVNLGVVIQTDSNGNEAKFEDVCENQGRLIEYYCNGQVAKVAYECKCEKGVCLGDVEEMPVAKPTVSSLTNTIKPIKTAVADNLDWVAELKVLQERICNVQGKEESCENMKLALEKVRISKNVLETLSDAEAKFCKLEDKDGYCNQLKNAKKSLSMPKGILQDIKNLEAKMCNANGWKLDMEAVAGEEKPCNRFAQARVRLEKFNGENFASSVQLGKVDKGTTNTANEIVAKEGSTNTANEIVAKDIETVNKVVQPEVKANFLQRLFFFRSTADRPTGRFLGVF